MLNLSYSFLFSLSNLASDEKSPIVLNPKLKKNKPIHLCEHLFISFVHAIDAVIEIFDVAFTLQVPSITPV